MEKWSKSEESEILGFIEYAISVAASEFPHEFMKRRAHIAHMLYSSNLCCDPPPSHEDKIQDKGAKNSYVQEASREAKECEPKHSHILKQVSTINATLSNADESESTLRELLRKLETIPMTYEILLATRVGVNVRLLQKHQSKAISSTAKKLVRGWKKIADEYYERVTKAGGEHNLDFKKPASPPPSHKWKYPSGVDEKYLKEKIEASKKRLREGYRKVETVRRQHTIQLIEINDIPKDEQQHKRLKKRKNY